MTVADDLRELADDIHGHRWVDAALGGVGTGLDLLGTVLDPLGSLAAWGVSWLMEHVRPLREALDRLAGDPAEVAMQAATWQGIATDVTDARTRLTAAIGSQTADWQGESGDAYRRQAGEQAGTLQGIAWGARGIAYAVEGAGLLVGLVRGLVCDLLAQFVATLAARLPEWLAEEGLTLGIGTPVVVGQVAALVAKWAAKIRTFLRALLDSLRRFSSKVDELGRLLMNRPGNGKGPGETIPRPRTGNQLPADAELPMAFRGENDPTNESRVFRPAVVHYMDAAEREQHRLFVGSDGRLRSARDGDLYDTSTGYTAWSGDGRAIFVVDRSGNLYATADHRMGLIHHSSLVAGEPVAGAGEIEVVDGQLLAMTDRSGHYQPSPEMNDLALKHLRRKQGLVPHPDFHQYGWDGEER